MADEPVIVPITRLAHGADLPLPAAASSGSAGVDLRAAIDGELVMAPGERRAVPTGVSLALPHGFEAQIRPRSGLALRYGLTLLNTPGTIDSDYRGEIQVILINLGQERFRLKRGDRVAQMVIAPVCRVRFSKQSDLPPTDRGDGGFGSSGIS